MDQVTISRETLARLRADRAATKDETVAAGLDSQIRLHADLAGEPFDLPEPPLAAKPAKPAKAES